MKQVTSSNCATLFPAARPFSRKVLVHAVVQICCQVRCASPVAVQELCQRLKQFFSHAEAATQDGTGPEDAFAIAFKVTYCSILCSIMHSKL